MEAYFKGMQCPVRRRQQWGGYAEVVLCGHTCQVNIALFAQVGVGKYALISDPVRPEGVTLSHYLFSVDMHSLRLADHAAGCVGRGIDT